MIQNVCYSFHKCPPAPQPPILSPASLCPVPSGVLVPLLTDCCSAVACGDTPGAKAKAETFECSRNGAKIEEADTGL